MQNDQDALLKDEAKVFTLARPEAKQIDCLARFLGRISSQPGLNGLSQHPLKLIQAVSK